MGASQTWILNMLAKTICADDVSFCVPHESRRLMDRGIVVLEREGGDRTVQHRACPTALYIREVIDAAPCLIVEPDISGTRWGHAWPTERRGE
jgi:hypothetical protein